MAGKSKTPNLKALKGLNKPNTVAETEQEEVVAVATDNVPDGEPKENEDGSVTVYDEYNQPVGTLSAEEVKAAEESVTAVEIDGEQINLDEAPTEQENSLLEKVVKGETPKVEVDQSAFDEARKPKENVKIRLRTDHSCNIGTERYDFKAGKVYTVPKNVKRILNRAGLLSPL